MTKALMIEVKNWVTGERAGGINPRDRNLVAIGGPLWQVLDYEPKGDWEIRLVRDGRDLSRYSGNLILDVGIAVPTMADVPADARVLDVEGVVVLENEDEINAALEHIPAKIYGDMNRAKDWGESRGITPRAVAEKIVTAIAEKAMPEAWPGHSAVAARRNRPVAHVIYGHPTYALTKRLHDEGCPHLYREPIPKV
ncbi:MAG: hypothetical protein JRD89_13580 [Deltaproteobacteria bacterium]|nr:hypothetical protein [Deltaproteobacteria bacterium]